MKVKQSLQQARSQFLRAMQDHLVIKDSVALLFLFASFLVLVPILQSPSHWIRLAVIVYGFIVIALAGLLIGQYLLKSFKLQLNTSVRRYSAILSLNTVFGLLLPLKIVNFLLSKLMPALRSLPDQETIFCEVRRSVVHMYYSQGVADQLSQFIFWGFVLTLALFLFGGLAERLTRKS